MPLRPTAQQHHWTIRLVGYGHLLELDEPPWLETRPQLCGGKRLAIPNHVIIPFTNLGSEAALMPYVPAQRVVIADGERTCELDTCQTADDTTPRILAD